MGAIQRDGYEFEVEFSQISKKAALHVYRKGDFIEEITFDFKGIEPDSATIEKEVEKFVKKDTLN